MKLKKSGVKGNPVAKDLSAGSSKHVALSRRQFITMGAALGTSVLLKGLAAGPSISWAAQAKPIKVGVLNPLSGVFTSMGEHAVKGITTIFDQHGWKVGGREIVMIKEDDEADPKVALRKARKLVESDEVDVLLGVISSAVAYAMKDYVTRAKRVWMGNAAADGIFRKANYSPYAFRSSPSSWQDAWPMGNWLVKKGYKRVFITGPDYAMGHEMTTAFKAGWGNGGGGEPVGVILPPLGTTDFAPYLAQIKNSNPDCVFASFAGADSVRFVQQFDTFGLKKNIVLTGMGYLVEEDTTPAQGDSAIGVYTSISSAYGLDTPENKEFIGYYKKHYNSTPSVDDYMGAITATIFYEAAKMLGGDVSNQLALSKAIQTVNFVSPRGPTRIDPETNNVICNIYIREARKEGGQIHNYVVATYKDVVHPAQ